MTSEQKANEATAYRRESLEDMDLKPPQTFYRMPKPDDVAGRFRVLDTQNGISYTRHWAPDGSGRNIPVPCLPGVCEHVTLADGESLHEIGSQPCHRLLIWDVLNEWVSIFEGGDAVFRQIRSQLDGIEDPIQYIFIIECELRGEKGTRRYRITRDPDPTEIGETAESLIAEELPAMIAVLDQFEHSTGGEIASAIGGAYDPPGDEPWADE